MTILYFPLSFLRRGGGCYFWGLEDKDAGEQAGYVILNLFRILRLIPRICFYAHSAKKKPFFLMKNGYQTWGGGMKNDMFFISNNFLYVRAKTKLLFLIKISFK